MSVGIITTLPPATPASRVWSRPALILAGGDQIQLEIPDPQPTTLVIPPPITTLQWRGLVGHLCPVYLVHLPTLVHLPPSLTTTLATPQG